MNNKKNKSNNNISENYGNKSKKEMLIQIYRVTYIANINKMIDETRYINVLQKITMNGFKTYHIEDFDKLTLYMQNIGLNDSFNISILLHLRDTNYKKMSEIAILFTDIGEIFSHKKRKMVDRIHKIRKLIKNKLILIKSFKKIERLSNYKLFLKMNNYKNNTEDCVSNNNPIKHINYIIFNNKFNNNDNNIDEQVEINTDIDSEDDSEIHSHIDTEFNPNFGLTTNSLIQTSNKLSTNKINIEWHHHTRNDIMERLHLIAQKYFTLDQLKYMNVKLKYISEIDILSHEDIEIYYFDTLINIECSLKEWITICKMYIDIEVNYAECCEKIIIGLPTFLELKHFNIDIKNNE